MVSIVVGFTMPGIVSAEKGSQNSPPAISQMKGVDREESIEIALKTLRALPKEKYSNHSQYPDVETVVENGKMFWRVSFPLKKQIKGGQIIVMVDSVTGAASLGHGE